MASNASDQKKAIAEFTSRRSVYNMRLRTQIVRMQEEAKMPDIAEHSYLATSDALEKFQKLAKDLNAALDKIGDCAKDGAKEGIRKMIECGLDYVFNGEVTQSPSEDEDLQIPKLEIVVVDDDDVASLCGDSSSRTEQDEDDRPRARKTATI